MRNVLGHGMNHSQTKNAGLTANGYARSRRSVFTLNVLVRNKYAKSEVMYKIFNSYLEF